ncbi:fatty acid--CoA ligase [Fibrella forsythiae]|uniref:Fatty acid--CoA ligase n=1 Tax=Fibrella forsythiae TaxID=2817061 RepID=A0ABS3JCL1_9BACT|nr:fatty acid--CoA ligase [Fibrella forsythiae]MBO0947733.1 fatty acid--CoA ligase [Fibrella forsythiae]
MSVRLIPRVAAAHEPPMLIKNLLRQSNRYEPNREIVYRNLFRMTYTTFNERVQRLANALTDLGVQAGDTVAVMDWDSHRYLEAFFAVPCLGAVLHTINVRLSPFQILYTINHAADKVILVHEDFLPLLDGIRSQLTTVETVIVLSDSVYDAATKQINTATFTAPDNTAGEYETLLEKASGTFDFPDFDENALATTFYTTGTTGHPKGVYFSHRQLFMHTMGLCTYVCGYQAVSFQSTTDVYMPITPMFHVHAWGFPYLATMLSARQVYPGKYEPEMLLKLILTEGVTFSHCVPTILNMLVSSPAAVQFREQLSRWKVIIGGSALTKGLATAAMKMGIRVYQGYGMSETAPIMAVSYLNDQERTLPIDEQVPLLTQAGRIAPFVEMRLMDELGNFMPHDGEAVGEVVARGPWLTQGYWQEPERGSELWRDGWLHTGDVASITPDNWVHIADRTKDVIKTGGEWVSSLEIEDLLSQVEGVAEVAVIGLPDEKWGERPHAIIVPKPDYKETLQPDMVKAALQARVDRGELNKWYVPDRVIFVSEIPKTSVGKLDKKRMRAEMKEEIMK